MSFTNFKAHLLEIKVVVHVVLSLFWRKRKTTWTGEKANLLLSENKCVCEQMRTEDENFLLFWRWSLHKKKICASIFCAWKKGSNKMRWFFFFSSDVEPSIQSATLASSLSHTLQTNAHVHTQTHTPKLHPENYITSLLLSENYICRSPFHQSLPRSPFFFPSLPLPRPPHYF